MSRYVVVGGGLAGTSAALRLADAGQQVTLIEKRPRLGGAAFSFERAGLSVDNGQHVFLRCCVAYQAFLDRLGVADRSTLQHRLDIPVLRPDGRSARLSRLPGLPAPAHLGAALSRFSLLRPIDRARVIRGALALRLLDPADRRLDEWTFGAFLRDNGQNDDTIEAMWSIVTTATLNLPPDEASLALAAKVFRTGLLDHAPAADLGYVTAPMGQLHDVAARAALTQAGVEVLLGEGVESISGTAVHVAGRVIDSDGVILAIPPRHAFTVLPELAGTEAKGAADLGTSPIVNVHVVYDRRVTDLDFAAAVNSPAQWIFDRTESSGLHKHHPGAQYLAVTVSSADAIVDVPARTLTDQFTAALSDLFPRARHAQVIDAFVTRERNATFRQAAGTWALRPDATAGPDGVWLAGSWTDTGWPDTMESAVRSGVTAAEAVLQLGADKITEYAA